MGQGHLYTKCKIHKNGNRHDANTVACNKYFEKYLFGWKNDFIDSINETKILSIMYGFSIFKKL